MRILGHLFWLVITVISAVFAISFATSNTEYLTLYLWPFDGNLTAPAWIIILSSFVIGGGLCIILLFAQWVTIRAKLWRLQSKLDKLQALKNQKPANKIIAHESQDTHFEQDILSKVEDNSKPH